MEIKDIKVLMVEDNEQQRETFPLVLKYWGIHCETLPNADNIIHDIETIQPNVVLMDIQLNDKDYGGIEAVRTIRKKFDELPIIMHTTFDDSDRIFEAFKAGAKGYLLKTTEPNKVVEALRNIIENGAAPMNPSIAAKVMDYFELRGNKLAQLTKLEKEVLDHIKIGLTEEKIALKMFISVHTVRFHKKNIYKKLEVHSREELKDKY